METREIRLENLMALAAGYKRNFEFCETIGMNPTYFSQVKTGRKAIGDELARRIEQALNLQRGYLDTPKEPPKATEATSHIPTETLGVAYALEALSAPVRDGLVRLIFTMAAEAADNKKPAGTQGQERVVAPFRLTIGSDVHAEGFNVSAQKVV